MRQLLRRLRDWFYDRLGLDAVVKHLLHHEIPRDSTRSPAGWMYIFGNALVALFILQLVSGSALATKYIPSAERAYDSLQYLNDEVWLGAFTRALHFFGASAMIVVLVLHMARVFLTGAYKFPREMNWISGVGLLILVFFMAYTGQLLRWDQDGVWTVVVGSKFAGRVPLIGESLMQFLLAGDAVGGATLSRFFALHVIILPLLILAVIGLHVFLVFKNGISEPPAAGRPVDPRTYRAYYQELTRTGGARYWPDAAWRELVFIVVVFAVVVALALLLGPQGPGLPPDPTALRVDPRPDWFLLWYYTLIWLKPRALDTFTMVYLPMAFALALLLLPIVANKGERSPRRRPWAVAIVGVAVVVFGLLIGLGLNPYWVPQFVTTPPTAQQLAGAPNEVVVGSRVFYERGCQYCHQVLDRGGRYGPELNTVTRRLAPEEITVRIVMGVRNMPAYRDTLDDAELQAILAYLHWLEGRSR